MITFPVFASTFEMHPNSGDAFDQLAPLFSLLQRVEFTLRVVNASKNQGQMDSDFDKTLERSIELAGAESWPLPLPSEIPQEFDFAFKYADRVVTVEVEKANREKILRDILKCHMYLHSGADYAVVALPRNYPHSLGVWNLFDFGVQRFRECVAYDFGRPELLNRIVLLGYTQYETASGDPLSTQTRKRMRLEANAGPAQIIPDPKEPA